MPQLMPLNWMASVFLVVFLLMTCLYLYFYKMILGFSGDCGEEMLLGEVWEW